MMPKCKSCGAEILWVTTSSGKKMPIDAAPRKVIVLLRGPNDRIDKRVDQETIDKEATAEVVTAYTAHFATCPNADEHRK
jgi:hypothetical protein